MSENDLKPHFCPLPLVCGCGSNGRLGLFHSTICHNQVNNWVKWKNVWFINCIHWLDRKPVHSYLHISVVSSAQICLRDMVDKNPTCYDILLLHTGFLLLSGDKWRKSYRVAGVNVAQEMGNQMNGLNCLSISLYYYYSIIAWKTTGYKYCNMSIFDKCWNSVIENLI